jgi:hypothetical protein
MQQKAAVVVVMTEKHLPHSRGEGTLVSQAATVRGQQSVRVKASSGSNTAAA